MACSIKASRRRFLMFASLESEWDMLELLSLSWLYASSHMDCRSSVRRAVWPGYSQLVGKSPRYYYPTEYPP